MTGADKSAAMLGVAASSITDPRVSWIQAPAESVDRYMTEPVNAVICNSAIWQTDFAAAGKAVRAVLKAGGRFAFNVPVDFLGDSDDYESRDRYPRLLAEMLAIAERDYGWAPADGAPGRVRQRLTRESIGRFLAAAGLDVEQVTEVTHHDSAEAQRAWLSVPIFTRDRLRGLAYADRMRVLDKAYQRLGPGQTERARWVVDESGGVLRYDEPAQLRRGIEDNLRSLDVGHLAAVNLRLMDAAEPGQRFDDQLAAMVKARDDGLIGGVGLSNVTSPQCVRPL
ncbi:MAG: methyltransferase domain-containing protein [Streptosporangiaceae bacterium]